MSKNHPALERIALDWNREASLERVNPLGQKKQSVFSLPENALGRRRALLALAFTPLAALVACVVEPAGPPNPHPPVPAVRYETIPTPPGPPAVWIWQPGHWHWDGIQYVWIPGRYVRRDPNWVRWVPGHWAVQYGVWRWIPGHWV